MKAQANQGELNAGCLPSNHLSIALMQEIKSASGLSHGDLASRLSGHIEMTDKMIGQYLNGKKSMGRDRMVALARAAKKCGWEGGIINQVLEFAEFNKEYGSSDVREEFNKQQKRDKRREKATLKNLEDAVAELIQMGWDDAHLVALAGILATKYISPHDLTMGGLIDFESLHRRLGEKNKDYPELGWVEWNITRNSSTGIPI